MVTEKRFTHKKWYNERQLFDGDEPFAIVDVYIQAEAICDKLNELTEENQDNKAMIEFLTTENTQIMNELKTRTQIQYQLKEENKELKEFKQQVITLIDNNIEKLNNTDTVSLIPRESIMVLERLKKVIDDDKE